MTKEQTENQSVTSDSDVSAENVTVGRDFNQINRTAQTAGNNLTKFPVDDPKNHGNWVKFFTALLSYLPIQSDQLDTLFAAMRYTSWIVGIGSAASVFRSDLPIAIAVPFDASLLGIAIVIAIVSGKYFDVRNETDCPECGTPFALETVAVNEFPEFSDSENRRGERTVSCTVCAYENTERFAWERESV